MEITKYQPHSPTSIWAAAEIENDASTLRGKVYRMLFRKPLYGATDEEIQLNLNMNPNTQRPRRVELVEKGLVRDSGVTRNTISGRKAVVWVISRLSNVHV